MQPRFPAILASAAFSLLILLSVPARAQGGGVQLEVLGPHSGVIGNSVQFSGQLLVDGVPLEGVQINALSQTTGGAEIARFCGPFTDAFGNFACETGALNMTPGAYAITWIVDVGPTSYFFPWSFAVLGAPSKVTYTGPATVSLSENPTWSARLDSAIVCTFGGPECHAFNGFLEGYPVDFYLDLDNNAISFLCSGIATEPLSPRDGFDASCSGWGGVTISALGTHRIFARFAGDPRPPVYWTASSTSALITITAPPPSMPSSKDECKNGGWQRFGVFKNQGDCVSFVATKGKH